MFSLINPPGKILSRERAAPSESEGPGESCINNKAEKRDMKRRPKFLYAHRHARNEEGKGQVGIVQ